MKKSKPTAAQAREAAALAFLRSRTRVGEVSLKIWCGRQQPPLPVYQAEDALAVLVARGLATLTTDQRTGNRSWSAVAPPATASPQRPSRARGLGALRRAGRWR